MSAKNSSFSFSCYICGPINFSKYSNSRRAMSLQPHIQRLQHAHESPGDLVKTADSDSGALPETLHVCLAPR